MNNKALVIFSGGQDSTTCLFEALQNYKEVEAITFAYGQKHTIEIEQSKVICKKYNVKQTVIDISFLNTIVESALISNKNIDGLNKDGYASAFVPNRNQLFITLAHSLAQKIEAGVLVGGMCQTDYNGFPDCRRKFIDALQSTTNLGSDVNIKIETPCMNLTKAETWKLANKLGCLQEVVQLSHTCYNGVRDKLHSWGYGCEKCPSCEERIKGYNQAHKNNWL